jgi:hypothetical protein
MEHLEETRGRRSTDYRSAHLCCTASDTIRSDTGWWSSTTKTCCTADSFGSGATSHCGPVPGLLPQWPIAVRETLGQIEDCPEGEDQETVMFHGTYDRTARADRYREVATEYSGLSKAATDPFLCSYYLRIAEDYLMQSQRELRASERERITALASGHMPSCQPQPNTSQS